MLWDCRNILTDDQNRSFLLRLEVFNVKQVNQPFCISICCCVGGKQDISKSLQLQTQIICRDIKHFRFSVKKANQAEAEIQSLGQTNIT